MLNPVLDSFQYWFSIPAYRQAGNKSKKLRDPEIDRSSSIGRDPEIILKRVQHKIQDDITCFTAGSGPGSG
jgi:hypothetical protein